MKRHAITRKILPGCGRISQNEPGWRRISHNRPGCKAARSQALPPRITLLLTAAAFFLGGCAGPARPSRSVDPDGSIPVGSFLRVTPVPDPLTLYDSKDALAADGLYYASWTVGESEEYINEDGDSVELFPAQATLLASEQKSGDQARAAVEGWRSASTDHYDITDSREETIAGQEYEIITYTMKNASSPWKGGVSAFTVHGTAAVCAELTFRDVFDGDPDRLLMQLLGCFSYIDVF